jgi:CheY-like chemotaxis protein
VSLSVANGAQTPVALVVEDEFFVRLDISTCLRKAGYFVLESASGEEAIGICQRSAAMIDIVITDINLGGPASGWDVAECFREERPDIPLLYMSAERVVPERCAPGSAFVTKPFQRREILNVCQELCNNHNRGVFFAQGTSKN